MRERQGPESIYSQSHLGWHFRKLKAQSSKVSSTTFQWKETLELWALSFETAFENVTPSGIGCTSMSFERDDTDDLKWDMRERQGLVSMCCLLRETIQSYGVAPMVGSLKLQVSFAEYSLFYRTLLQKRCLLRETVQSMWYEIWERDQKRGRDDTALYRLSRVFCLTKGDVIWDRRERQSLESMYIDVFWERRCSRSDTRYERDQKRGRDDTALYRLSRETRKIKRHESRWGMRYERTRQDLESMCCRSRELIPCCIVSLERHERSRSTKDERWGAGVETQKNVREEIGGWGRVPFNEPYATLLSTNYDGA